MQGAGDNHASRGNDLIATSGSVTTSVNSMSNTQHHNAAPAMTVNCTVSKLECHVFTNVRLAVIVVELTSPCNGKRMQVYTLQDTGLTSTLICKSVAKYLNLQRDLQNK